MSLNTQPVVQLNNSDNQAAVSPDLQTTVSKKPRLYFIDHLRSTMMMRLIVLHLAITYGAIAPWYYYDPAYGSDFVALILLTAFVLINGAFSMSFFFLLSAYFLPGSYERKGARAFLKDKFMRLGIPLVVFTFLVQPPLSYWGMQSSAVLLEFLGIEDPRSFTPTYWNLIGTGPLWFVCLLLIFVCGYVLWRKLNGQQPVPAVNHESKPPTGLAIIGFTLGVAVATFVLRFWFSFEFTIPFVGIRVSMLPQYLSLFVVGILAYRHNWFLTIPSRAGKIGLIAATVATLTLFPVAYAFGAAPVEGSLVLPMSGGLHWQSFVYSLWEAITCVGMCLGLLVFFRQRVNRQGKIGTFLANHSYVVYLVHAPVTVVLAFAVSGVAINLLLKWVLVSIIAIPLCFGVGYLLRKLPFARAIL